MKFLKNFYTYWTFFSVIIILSCITFILDFIFFHSTLLISLLSINLTLCNSALDISVILGQIDYSFLNFLSILWFFFFNLGVLYSLFKASKGQLVFRHFHKFIPFLLGILIVILSYNEIIPIIDILIPDLKMTTSDIRPENYNVSFICTVVFLFFVKFTTKILKTGRMTNLEYIMLLLFLTLVVNSTYLYKATLFVDGEAIQKLIQIFQIGYLENIFLGLKIILLVYVGILTWVYDIDNDESFLIECLTKKTFTYLLLIQAFLYYILSKDIVSNSTNSFYMIHNFLNLYWFALFFTLIVLTLERNFVETCHHNDRHLKQIDSMEFSSTVKYIDKYIWEKIPDTIMIRVFQLIKRYFVIILLVITFLPLLVVYITPLVLLSKFKIMVLLLWFVVSHSFAFLLAFPTTLKYLYTVGLFCCSPGPVADEIIIKISARGPIRKAIVEAIRKAGYGRSVSEVNAEKVGANSTSEANTNTQNKNLHGQDYTKSKDHTVKILAGLTGLTVAVTAGMTVGKEFVNPPLTAEKRLEVTEKLANKKIDTIKASLLYSKEEKEILIAHEREQMMEDIRAIEDSIRLPSSKKLPSVSFEKKSEDGTNLNPNFSKKLEEPPKGPILKEMWKKTFNIKDKDDN